MFSSYASLTMVYQLVRNLKKNHLQRKSLKEICLQHLMNKKKNINNMLDFPPALPCKNQNCQILGSFSFKKAVVSMYNLIRKFVFTCQFKWVREGA